MAKDLAGVFSVNSTSVIMQLNAEDAPTAKHAGRTPITTINDEYQHLLCF